MRQTTVRGNRCLPAVALVALATSLLAPVGPASAQEWPAKPIRLLVGFPVGGAADILARLHAARLQDAIGQTIVVDNRGGAGGVIATELAARAAGDGYTLLFTSLPHVINPPLYGKVAYHPVRDFQPVTLLVNVPLLMAVPATLPMKTVKDVIALAKANPGKVNYGSAGNGSSSHLAVEMFKSMAGVDIQHIPYKGTGPLITDLLSGQVSMTIASIVPLIPQVRAGKLRPVAVTGVRRSGALPDVPTIAEAGVPGYDMTNWFGILAPAGLPAPILGRLDAVLRRIVAAPDVREVYAQQGADPVGAGPEAFAKVIAADIPKWDKVVRQSGARVD
ncbi:MAG: tripartite tricarboxylate transporter substrate binding protein [Rhodocyclaceae bacterium]|jgi:tripartite-type tricarboxylate transporter receptor subunit TctC|nr:tripartite tricarboxylate transporter substrate binding protein [Rhodocyclaceae bacterium]MCA3076924.1 tripartite tricarboxylate transporter substrate binding protein [Rhodocyclaceae bacterium]MCA3090490.1 tripartite tricarboxylate transporter substrate binding protein [Rhodocyclaceae bacterium]MCA3094716.1 tripartite tricarboxylate transporter substrate binding protein [Rhodocyclaceae bacterium]MCA3097905.1 tripartite tricarboxylate transporter substrate binding protein [Rhodocyclaceae bact